MTRRKESEPMLWEAIGDSPALTPVQAWVPPPVVDSPADWEVAREEVAEFVAVVAAEPSLLEPVAPEGFALFGRNLFGDEVLPVGAGPLATKFTLPPFSVLDARSGAWQDRKRAWLALGIQSELGRGGGVWVESETGGPDDRQKAMKDAARCFGQDLMRGEHVVGEKRVSPGNNPRPAMDHHEGEGLKTERGTGSGKPIAATAVSQKLAPGGGGGGCWIGGPKTGSTEKFTADLRGGLAFRTTTDPYRESDTWEVGATQTGTSIFDPVLCELMYRWFCPPAGLVLDPFAGGSVRGIVAAKLGVQYLGIDLRPEQLDADRVQAERICSGDPYQPLWVEGDAADAVQHVGDLRFDFVFSCPPYADLEQYSDDPRDLSTMDYPAFIEAYGRIVVACLASLKPDRFACFVVGDVRDKQGYYRGLPEATVAAFTAAGARKYNEGILVTAIGSLPIRVGKQFDSGRKLGKSHQNVLVFVKGDPKRAAEACNGQLDLPVV